MSLSVHIEAVDWTVTDATGARLAYDTDRRLLGGDLGRAFRQLESDPATFGFLEQQLRRRHHWAPWMARAVLRTFMSDFAVNGVLATYRLHLLSTQQWASLLRGRPGGRLLDVGAGFGDVTRALAPHFDDVLAVETSAPLVRRLRAAGLRAELIDVTTDEIPDAPYDAIALLNVLDRCARPSSMLARARRALATDGRLLISMPLPYQPMYYRGARGADPIERLPIGRGPWERQARDLVERVIVPNALRVESFARAPYLSEGDRHVPFYELDAIVCVCRAISM